MKHGKNSFDEFMKEKEAQGFQLEFTPDKRSIQNKVKLFFWVTSCISFLSILCTGIFALLASSQKEYWWGVVGCMLLFFASTGICWQKAVQPICALLDTAATAVENECRAEHLRAQAEIHALQSQINPHFLYNTLETIRSIALQKKIQEIAEITESLSMLFRYSISNPDEMTTLGQELQSVRSYLKIQQYRFPDKISYKENVEDPQLLQWRLPVLTVQPIVENAVRHGLEPKMGTGYIHLEAFMTPKHIVLRIKDNGVGINEDRLSVLRQRLESGEQVKLDDTVKEKHLGIALQNVNQRLKFYFGKQYHIEIMSTLDVGTIVEMRLPLHENRNFES